MNDIDWQSSNALLKAEFPLSVSNPEAVYDLGVGSVARGNNTATAYEVYAQQWADLTDADGSYGVSVLNDSKYGWDKPADNTLRLTLLHTPATKGGYAYQNKQDFRTPYVHLLDRRARGRLPRGRCRAQGRGAQPAASGIRRAPPRRGAGPQLLAGRLAEPQCGAAGAQTGRGFGRICGSFLRDLGPRVAAGRGGLRGADRRRPGAQRRGGRRGRRGVQRPRAALRGWALRHEDLPRETRQARPGTHAPAAEAAVELPLQRQDGLLQPVPLGRQLRRQGLLLRR